MKITSKIKTNSKEDDLKKGNKYFKYEEDIITENYLKERVHSEMKTFESQYSQFPLWGKVSANASRTLFVNIIK